MNASDLGLYRSHRRESRRGTEITAQNPGRASNSGPFSCKTTQNPGGRRLEGVAAVCANTQDSANRGITAGKPPRTGGATPERGSWPQGESRGPQWGYSSGARRQDKGRGPQGGVETLSRGTRHQTDADTPSRRHSSRARSGRRRREGGSRARPIRRSGGAQCRSEAAIRRGGRDGLRSAQPRRTNSD